MEFNLYGDPKYGIGEGMCPFPDASVAASDVQAAAVPTSSLEINIPDYEVTSSNGLDTARIPGGLMLLEKGLPMVPIYVVTQDYPKGYRVQDVVLAARSGMVTATGLNLPLVGDDPTSVGENSLAQTTRSAPGWYPEKDFAWEIDEHADGTTTLIVRMYPFYYDAATTDVQFYKDYSFDIRYISPTIEITGLATDKQIYQQDIQLLQIQ